MKRALRSILAASVFAALPAAAQEMPKVVQTRCGLCHGVKGEAGNDELPVLAGQHADYLAKQLRDFQSGKRTGAMQRFAKPLTEGDISAVAAWYAAQKPPAHKVNDKDLHAAGRYLFLKNTASTGLPPCQACHGDKAQGTAIAPRLASQHAPYIERQLKEFNQRARNNDNEIMHTVAAGLSAFDMKALAEYLSTLE
ncbi:MAG TPA: c-type cytochrome [Usitatibacteraceae bacterium]|nr:c-type cytochrome [Usitatibacteraceae bacterium]